MPEIPSPAVECNICAGDARHFRCAAPGASLGSAPGPDRPRSGRGALFFVVHLVLFGVLMQLVPLARAQARTMTVEQQALAFARWGKLGQNAIRVGRTTVLTPTHCVLREQAENLYLQFNDGTCVWSQVQIIDEVADIAVVRIPDVPRPQPVTVVRIEEAPPAIYHYFALAHSATAPFKVQEESAQELARLHAQPVDLDASTCPPKVFHTAWANPRGPIPDESWQQLGGQILAAGDGSATARTWIEEATVRWGQGGHAGVLIDDDRVIAAAHCAEREGTAQVTVTFHDNCQVLGFIERLDRDRDLALIRIAPECGHRPIPMLPEGYRPSDGATVLICGHPKGIPFAVNVGEYLGKRSCPKHDSVIELQLSSRGGCSGGPVTCLDPHLLGIVLMREEGEERTIAASWSSINAFLDEDHSVSSAQLVPNVEVTVYTATWCSSCRYLEVWLNEHGIAYHQVDVDRYPDRWEDAKRRAAGAGLRVRGLPLTEVSGSSTQWVEGFDVSALSQTLQEAGIGFGG